MFQVKTYIYVPINRVNKQLPSEISVDDIDTLREAEPYLDFERLDGHIELSYQGQPILTDEFGDFIKEYWDYLLQAIRSFMKNGSGRMYLPDQPIPIAMKEQGPNWVLMTVGEDGKYGKWLLPKKELLMTLLEGAAYFYKGLSEALSESIVKKYGYGEMYNYCLDLKKQYFGG